MDRSSSSPSELYQAQAAFFATGATRDLAFRRHAIKTLIAAIQKNEERIIAALWKDLRKSPTAVYTGEILLILQEAAYVLNNLEKWAAPQKARSPFFFPMTASTILKEPYGSVLIISPYNVPFVGTFTLLIGAIASGNCATVKVSEISEHSAEVALAIIREAFPPNYIAGVTGDAEYSQKLLEVPFDFVFFMGSTTVGKSVMAACAKHPSPVALQLSGKCPAIVDTSASIDAAAKRIVWGKFLNAGQECVAIDHVYVPLEKKALLITALKKYIREFYGENPQESSDYERIINKRYFDRITRFLNEGTIVSGGKTDSDDLYIEPTIIDDLPENALASQEEIFGPILPLFTYASTDTLLSEIRKKTTPLAIYVFSNNTTFQERILRGTVSGSVCINDALIHNASFYVPVGGVGASGFGRIHGKYTFEMFSRLRTILKRSPTLDLPGRFPPANEKLLPLMRKFLG